MSHVYTLIRYIENKASEKDLEDEDYARTLPAEQCAMMEPDGIREVSSKLHHVLTELTTGEAHAQFRRCKEENGLLAWKRLSMTMNPKTLAAGLKAI